MERLKGRMGWEVVEEEWPDFKGRIYKNRPRSLNELLGRTVEKHRDRVGFVSANRSLTFGRFDATVNRIAAGLSKSGVTRGDRVSLLLATDIDFPLCFFAIQKLGAIAVPLNTRFKGGELAYEITDSESRVLIVDEEYWPSIAPVRNQLNTVTRVFLNAKAVPDGITPFATLLENRDNDFPRALPSESDDALILYTSGTTGKPKGAILHHRGLIATAMQMTDFAGTGPEDKLLCCIPLFHVTGLAMVMLSSVLNGIPCVYLRTFKVRDLLEVMSRERVTQIACVPNIIWLMVNHPDFDHYDFSAFRQAFLGGSAATEEMVSGILAKLPHLSLSIGWGLTEGHGSDSSTPFEDALRKIRAVGKPQQLVDVKIENEDGHELPPEGVGEIMIKGPMITKGYWKNPEATRAAITPEGWLHTGDIGKLDSEGFLYILDRKKDMINRGGEKIYSLEVENVIMNHPAVLEVAVVGVPDHIMGEAVKAAVVLRPGRTASEEGIREFCARELADYKVPKYIQFLAALPRNPAGKVIKGDLRSLPDSPSTLSTRTSR